MSLSDDVVLARETVTCISPTRREEAAALDLATAYAIAHDVRSQWSAAGHTSNGVKIGLTTTSVWPTLGVTAPVWGSTYAETTHAAGREPFDLRELVAPRLEAEVVVGLSAGLRAGSCLSDVADAVAWVALGWEIVDSHFEGWWAGAAALVADFGGHAALLLGARTPLSTAEVRDLDQLVVELTSSTGSTFEGSGANVAGGPVRAIAELLAAPHAPALAPGSVVSTGALTGGAHAVAPGQTWWLSAPHSPLADLSVTFGLEQRS